MRIREHNRRRCGVTTVETAMVMLPLMLMMFSIFEYGRFVMVRQLLDLGTELGCRCAVATNTSSTVASQVQTVVDQYLVNMNSTTHFSSAIVAQVIAVPSTTWDPSLTSTGPTSWTVVPPSNATLAASPRTPLTASDIAGGATDGLASVNAIQPGYPIAVRCSGNFKMMFPTLLYVSPTVPMTSMVILTCEGT